MITKQLKTKTIDISIDSHPRLVHDVRAAPNLNSRRLRDASAAPAAPDLMNREGWGVAGVAKGGRSDGHRILRADKWRPCCFVHTPYVLYIAGLYLYPYTLVKLAKFMSRTCLRPRCTFRGILRVYVCRRYSWNLRYWWVPGGVFVLHASICRGFWYIP